MDKYLANIDIFPPGGFKAPGSGIGARNLGSPGTVLNQVLSSTIGVMTVVAAIWFVIQLFIGAIGIVTSGGEKAALESAKNKITYGLIGIIVVISAIFLLELFGKIIGFDLILNPAEFINQNFGNSSTGPL